MVNSSIVRYLQKYCNEIEECMFMVRDTDTVKYIVTWPFDRANFPPKSRLCAKYLNDNYMGAKLLGPSICALPSRALSCVFLSLFKAASDLPCKIPAKFCGSQYLIPLLWCTFPNINWVLLFKTGKIFPKLVRNLAGWFFYFKPWAKTLLHSLCPPWIANIPPGRHLPKSYVDKNCKCQLYSWSRHCIMHIYFCCKINQCAKIGWSSVLKKRKWGSNCCLSNARVK